MFKRFQFLVSFVKNLLTDLDVMTFIVEGVVIVRGVIAGVPIEDELPLVHPTNPLLFLHLT